MAPSTWIRGSNCSDVDAPVKRNVEEQQSGTGVHVTLEARKRDRGWTLQLKGGAGWILSALVLLLALWILRSFAAPLIWAAILALASWPAYRGFANRLPTKWASSVTPGLFTAVMILLVLGPLMFAFITLMTKAHLWAQQVVLANKEGLATPDWLQAVPIVGSWRADQWNAILGTPDGVALWLQSADPASLAQSAQLLGQFVAHHTFVVAFTILTLFFLYRGGESLAGNINRIVQQRLGKRGESYVVLGVVAVRATVNGMIVVGLFDGALLGIIYAVAGVPSAAAWGAITGLLAMFPVIPTVAVACVALVLLSKGAGVGALVVLIGGSAVLFAGEQLVRPLLISGSTKLSFLWVLMGSLGGLEALGLLGLFVGPVVLALGAALLREWAGVRDPGEAVQGVA